MYEYGGEYEELVYWLLRCAQVPSADGARAAGRRVYEWRAV